MKKIIICEVGPRDGFQNIDKFINTEIKLKIIDMLCGTGIKKIQFTSFMSPKAIPQLIDSQKIAKTCLEKYGGSIYFYALIANLKGAQIARECGVNNLSYVTSSTESHNLANVKKTISDSIDELGIIMRTFPEIDLNWDVAMAFGCPFEGPLSDDHIIRHIEKGMKLGIRKITLCDTIGIATPDLVKRRLINLKKEFPECFFRVHIHDTRNMGMINSFTAIECGITEIETSICGLGGCPYSPGASGNTSTEDFVYMLNNMGFVTNIDFYKLLSTAIFTRDNIEGIYSGHHINIKEKCGFQ